MGSQMVDTPGIWDGDEWELYATQLLHLRHPDGALQETPSEYRGDYGIDSFVRASGLAYQCYAAQEPLGNAELHSKQRDKIRIDTDKLISKSAEVEALLAPNQLQRWTLLVPRFTSTPLLAYCSERAAAIRSHGLGYISNSFEIMVQQRSSFVTEERHLLGDAPGRVPIPELPATEGDVEHFADSSPDFLEALRQKLGARLDGETAEQQIRGLVLQYLEGKNIEEHLRQSVPPLYEAVQEVRRRRERALSGLSQLELPQQSDRLCDVQTNLTSDLEERVGSLGGVVRDGLRDGIVIDWLGRCPLRLV